MTYPVVIIGAGLSGLAAGIRCARFDKKVLILEKHSKIGGLNSYYHRNGMLFEAGLHAITNFAPPGARHAPLNRLFRQLKLARHQLVAHEQITSEILFPQYGSLVFSNNFKQLKEEIARLFPKAADGFVRLAKEIDTFDAFKPRRWISTRDRLFNTLGDERLMDFLLCPLMFYGSAEENDMDFGQFAILFRSIFQEGMFRPGGTMKDFLDLLLNHYRSFGGQIRLRAGVEKIITDRAGTRVVGVRLVSGEEIACDCLLSTIGLQETLRLFPVPIQGWTATEKDRHVPSDNNSRRLSFIESIYVLPREIKNKLPGNRTIIFYNLAERFTYRRPAEPVDLQSGVICFPDNFQGIPEQDTIRLRITHLANYDCWRKAHLDRNHDEYRTMKANWVKKSQKTVGEIIGNFQENIVYEDSFTPVTIEKYTSKEQGAVYGNPRKIKDGRTSYKNLFIAGTDQGFLGIVGSMLSGISIVNQYILPN